MEQDRMDKIRDFLDDNKFIIFAVIAAIFIVGAILLVMSATSQQAPDEELQGDVQNGEGLDSTGGADSGGSTSDGGEGVDDTGSQASDTQGDTAELTWWGVFLSEEDVKPLIDRYEEENPGVSINYINQVEESNQISSYQSKLQDLSSASEASAPDIFMLDNGWMGLLKANIKPTPDDVMNASTFESTFYDFVATDFVDEGLVYGMPLWVDNLAIVYNQEMYDAEGFSQPDSNWSIFADEQVSALTKTNDAGEITQAGFSAADPINTEFWFEATNILMLQNGVDIVDSSGQAVFADDDASTEAVNFYKDLSGGENPAWSSNLNLDVAAFLEGKLANYMSTTWRFSDIVKYNQIGSLGISYRVMEVPQLASSEKVNFASYWGNTVNAGSTDSDAAWYFVKYLAEEDQLQLLNKTLQQNNTRYVDILYPRKDMQESQTSDELVGPFAKALSYTKSWKMGDKEQVKAAFKAIFESDSELSIVQNEVNSVLAKY